MTHDPDDDDLDPDAPISAAEAAHARGFGELVDRAVSGRVPAAMSADDRALLEVATVIRGTAGKIELAEPRARALVDAALLAAVDRDRPRTLSVPPPVGGAAPPDVIPLTARKRPLLPWIAATVATAVWETVATVIPGPMPRPRRISAMASVPLAQPTACWPAPSQAANSCSKAAPSRPRMYQPDSSARCTAASISAFWAR